MTLQAKVTQQNSKIMPITMKILTCFLLLAFVQVQSRNISINMPDIRPDHADQYLCMTQRLPASHDGHFIVGFNPMADAKRVHHLILYGCQVPGIYQRDSPNFVWDCGSMQSSDTETQSESFELGPICRGDQQILYGWALNAPSLLLPDGVGFKVGGLDSSIQFLVLQVHYGHYHAFHKQPDLTDNSGLMLNLRPNDQNSGITKRAGVLLLISLGYVPVGKSKHEIWCDIEDDINIHPFRFRVHTHKLGTKVLGAKVRPNTKPGIKSASQSDAIIGVQDPQKPQMFYPVLDDKMTISKGDSVYAHCEFDNNKTVPVEIGQTGNDEMCNFYLMYWTESPKLLSKPNCFGQNPRSSRKIIWQ